MEKNSTVEVLPNNCLVVELRNAEGKTIKFHYEAHDSGMYNTALELKISLEDQVIYEAEKLASIKKIDSFFYHGEWKETCAYLAGDSNNPTLRELISQSGKIAHKAMREKFEKADKNYQITDVLKTFLQNGNSNGK